MAKKKKIAPGPPAETIQPEQVAPAAGPRSRFLQAIAVLLLLAFLFQAYRFFRTGVSGYFNTVLVYAAAVALALAFIPRRAGAWKVNTVAVLLILFAGETYLRVSGKGFPNYTEKKSGSLLAPYIAPAYNYEPTHFFSGLWTDQPNREYRYTVSEYSYMHRTNELGLRERPLSAFSGQRPVIVLGDSFTYGAGAPGDSTPVAALENRLSALGQPALCLNAGAQGSDICFMARLYTDKLRALQPRVVVLNLNRSDFQDINWRGGDERFQNDRVTFRGGKWYDFPYSWSYLFRVLVHGVIGKDAEEKTSPEKYYEVRDIILDKIGDMRELARQDSAQLVVAFTPMPNEVRAGRMQLEEVRMIVQAQYPDVLTLDYLECFSRDSLYSANGPGSYYYPVDMHLTPRGYWLWGNILADSLAARGWLNGN